MEAQESPHHKQTQVDQNLWSDCSMEAQEPADQAVDTRAHKRESLWDEPAVGKRVRYDRSGRERPELVNDSCEDGNRARIEGRDHHRTRKDICGSIKENLEGWGRSNESRRGYRENEDRADTLRSLKDGDVGWDFMEGQGRLSVQLQEDEKEWGTKSISKPDFYRKESDDRRSVGGWRLAGTGRAVTRSWSPPDGGRRVRFECNESERQWSDGRWKKGFYWRDYDRNKEDHKDREWCFRRERVRDRAALRGETDFFRKDMEYTEQWKKRQLHRHQEQVENINSDNERDGWGRHRREAGSPKRDGQDKKDKQRNETLQIPLSSGYTSDTMERVGGNSRTALDYGQEQGLAAGSPFLAQRRHSVPSVDFDRSNNDADLRAVGDDELAQLGNSSSVMGSESPESFLLQEEGPPGLNESCGPSSSRVVGKGGMGLDMHSGRGRGPKGTSGYQGHGNPMGCDGHPLFLSNEGSGMLMRGMQQSGKGGRSRGGGKGGWGGGWDSQRGGGFFPPVMGLGPGPGPPGMAPHFGHMGPPGSMPVMGPNIGTGPIPGISPGGFPLLPFGAPVGWTIGQRAVDMGMLAGLPAAPGALPPRPNIGTAPGNNVFSAPPGLARDTQHVMQGPLHGRDSFGGHGMMPVKTLMTRVIPRINAPAGRAPSRGEQNDYSQHFVDTGLRPQNFIRDVELGERFEEYPKLKELITRKDKLTEDYSCPPVYMQCDLHTSDLSPELFGMKFDVILVDPPWEEYVRRAPGVDDSMEWWTFEEILNLPIEAIADNPSFIFLWVGDAEGLDQGRHCLRKWGYKRCEDICWVKTNKENPTPALRHDASTILQHSKEHCLMGVKGMVRRSSDGHIIHANIDTDIIISEEPPYGSTAKPEELYHIVEHFALGQRRLELFGEDHNIRAGWITVGKGLTSSNFNPQTYTKHFCDMEGNIWQGGRGNPPVGAPHLVRTTPEIEALRPKSPPPRTQQQQQQSQVAIFATQPPAANCNMKKTLITSKALSPQNVQAVLNPVIRG